MIHVYEYDEGRLTLEFKIGTIRRGNTTCKLSALFESVKTGVEYKAEIDDAELRQLDPFLHNMPIKMRHVISVVRPSIAIDVEWMIAVFTHPHPRYNSADAFSIRIMLTRVGSRPLPAPATATVPNTPLGIAASVAPNPQAFGGWLASSDPWAVYARSMILKV